MLVILWQILEDHNAELFCARRCKKFRKLGKVGLLEAITIAHRCPGQNLVRLCVDISNLEACYLLGNCKNN